MESNEVQLTLHDQLLAWYEIHKKEVHWGMAAVMVIGLVIGSIITYRNAKEQNANKALSKIMNASPSGAQSAPSAETLLKIAADYPGTDAGIRAKLLGAEAFFEAGRYSDAKAQFEKFLKDHRDTPYASQATFGVAVCLDAQNLTNDAVAAYNDVLKRHPNDNVAPRSKLALARHYEAQGKWSQAKDMYEDLQRTFGNNNTSVSSESYLGMQRLFLQHPELFQPKTPAPTTAPAPAAATNKP